MSLGEIDDDSLTLIGEVERVDKGFCRRKKYLPHYFIDDTILFGILLTRDLEKTSYLSSEKYARQQNADNYAFCQIMCCDDSDDRRQHDDG